MQCSEFAGLLLRLAVQRRVLCVAYPCLAGRRACQPLKMQCSSVPRCSRVGLCGGNGRSTRVVRLSCNASASTTRPSVQLGTAKLPTNTNLDTFNTYMYNWASTLTQSGANYPFVLPLKTDKTVDGFKISLLKSVGKGSFASAGDIEASVEPIPDQGFDLQSRQIACGVFSTLPTMSGSLEDVKPRGNIFFVRFYEGPAAEANRTTESSKDPEQRLDAVLDGLVDVQTIMQTMPQAIRKAVQMANSQ